MFTVSIFVFQNCSSGFEASLPGLSPGNNPPGSTLSTSPQQLKTSIEWDRYIAGEDPSPRFYLAADSSISTTKLFSGESCERPVGDFTRSSSELFVYQLTSGGLKVGNNYFSYTYERDDGFQSDCLNLGNYVYRGQKTSVTEAGTRAYQNYEDGSFIYLALSNSALRYSETPFLKAADFSFDVDIYNPYGDPIHKDPKYQYQNNQYEGFEELYPQIAIKQVLMRFSFYDETTETTREDWVVLSDNNELIVHRGAKGFYPTDPDVERYPHLPADGIHTGIKKVISEASGSPWVLMESGELYRVQDCNPQGDVCTPEYEAKFNGLFADVVAPNSFSVFALTMDRQQIVNFDYNTNPNWAFHAEAPADLSTFADSAQMSMHSTGNIVMFVTSQFQYCYWWDFSLKVQCPLDSSVNIESVYVNDAKIAIEFPNRSLDLYDSTFQGFNQSRTVSYNKIASLNNVKQTLVSSYGLVSLLESGRIYQDGVALDTGISRFSKLTSSSTNYSNVLWGVDQNGEPWEFINNFSTGVTAFNKNRFSELLVGGFDWSRDKAAPGVVYRKDGTVLATDFYYDSLKLAPAGAEVVSGDCEVTCFYKLNGQYGVLGSGATEVSASDLNGATELYENSLALVIIKPSNQAVVYNKTRTTYPNYSYSLAARFTYSSFTNLSYTGFVFEMPDSTVRIEGAGSVFDNYDANQLSGAKKILGQSCGILILNSDDTATQIGDIGCGGSPSPGDQFQNVKDIAGNGQSGFVLYNDGRFDVWGWNFYGGEAPYEMSSRNLTDASVVSDLSDPNSYVLAVLTGEGELFSWGFRSDPTKIKSFKPSSGVKFVGPVGGGNRCAVDENGVVWFQSHDGQFFSLAGVDTVNFRCNSDDFATGFTDKGQFFVVDLVNGEYFPPQSNLAIYNGEEMSGAFISKQGGGMVPFPSDLKFLTSVLVNQPGAFQ